MIIDYYIFLKFEIYEHITGLLGAGIHKGTSTENL